MAQLFPSSANTIARASIVGAGLVAITALVASQLLFRSPYATEQFVVRAQPVQFSHEHHVRGLGLDCRYCHTSVEESAFAGMPPTYTCMSCHSQIWGDSPMLAPVRESLALDKPIEWNRVHDVPDYAYFNHSIHIKKGVGCYECHGRVDEMPLAYQTETMTMDWCLKCHRSPQDRIRPRDEVFNLAWAFDKSKEYQVGEEKKSFDSRAELGLALAKQYEIPVADGHNTPLTNCAVCHR